MQAISMPAALIGAKKWKVLASAIRRHRQAKISLSIPIAGGEDKRQIQESTPSLAAEAAGLIDRETS
jgi:hypothetical protein